MEFWGYSFFRRFWKDVGGVGGRRDGFFYIGRGSYRRERGMEEKLR